MRPSGGSAFWFVIAWAALDVAIGTYLHVNGVNAISTALLVVGMVAFLVAATVGGRGSSSVGGILMLMVCAQAMVWVVLPYQADSFPSDPLVSSLALIGVALSVAAYLSARGTASPRRAQALLVGVAVLGLASRAAIVLVDPYPAFDVPRIQEAAGAAIRAGSDPYLTHVYEPGYPYLPVAAIAAGLGGFVGDARWAAVMGDALTVLGLLVLARRCRAPAMVGPSMAALWAWWGAGLYVAWQGFPEPILLGLLTCGVALSVGSPRRWILAGILLGAAAATKQFGLAALPYLVRSGRGRRMLVVAIVTAAVLVLPFLLWHTPEFLEGSFWSLLDAPGRDYALNLLVWPGGRVDPPYLPILVLALVVGWLVARRFDGVSADASWLAGSTSLLFIAFLANRIAFVNYYAIVMLFLLLLITVLVADGDSHDRMEHAVAANG
jgi:hypothetical protein